jgi:hypothetical protein
MTETFLSVVWTCVWALAILPRATRFVAFLDQLITPRGHLVEAVLELVDERALLRDLGVEGLARVLVARLVRFDSSDPS